MEKKEVTMKKGDTPKMSYDDLVATCHQLRDQVTTLYSELQRVNNTNFFKRLDYLFAVVENAEIFEDYSKKDFVQYCVDEISETMTLSEDSDTENKKEN